MFGRSQTQSATFCVFLLLFLLNIISFFVFILYMRLKASPILITAACVFGHSRRGAMRFWGSPDFYTFFLLPQGMHSLNVIIFLFFFVVITFILSVIIYLWPVSNNLERRWNKRHFRVTCNRWPVKNDTLYPPARYNFNNTFILYTYCEKRPNNRSRKIDDKSIHEKDDIELINRMLGTLDRWRKGARMLTPWPIFRHSRTLYYF